MTRTPEVNAAGGYTRESSANSDGVGLQVRDILPEQYAPLINFLSTHGQGQRQQRPLFSLPNGEPASFLLHNFGHADLTRRIIVSFLWPLLMCLIWTPPAGARWPDHR
jgi:hypothetical protein